MSVRAYRVKKIDRVDESSFNLWHDKELVGWLDRREGFYEKLDSSGGGMVEFPVETLREALKEVNMPDDVRVRLQADIEACEESDEEYVQYDCF